MKLAIRNRTQEVNMKIDNFTTARCIKCGWLKQFQPGIDYEAQAFECDCKVEKPKRTTIKESLNGAVSSKANKKNTES